MRFYTRERLEREAADIQKNTLLEKIKYDLGMDEVRAAEKWENSSEEEREAIVEDNKRYLIEMGKKVNEN